MRLWDVETAVPFRFFRRHNGSVKSVCVRPEEAAAATGTGERLRELREGRHDRVVGHERLA